MELHILDLAVEFFKQGAEGAAWLLLDPDYKMQEEKQFKGGILIKRGRNLKHGK